jgi:hypothetical protein
MSRALKDGRIVPMSAGFAPDQPRDEAGKWSDTGGGGGGSSAGGGGSGGTSGGTATATRISEIGTRVVRDAGTPNQRKAFESVTKPLRKKLSFGDQIAFLHDGQPIIGILDGADDGTGYLVQTTRGSFRVGKDNARHPAGFRGARED